MVMSKRMSLVISIALVLICSLAILVSAVASHCLGDGQWFQRSGSLCVLFAVILEIHQSVLREPQPSSTVSVEGSPAMMSPEVSTLDGWFRRFAWLGIISGTVIWGYGDLVF